MTDRPAEPGAMPEEVVSSNDMLLDRLKRGYVLEPREWARIESALGLASLYEQAVKERDKAVAQRDALQAELDAARELRAELFRYAENVVLCKLPSFRAEAIDALAAFLARQEMPRDEEG